MTLLLLFVVVSISVSFLCSILEAALLSITPSFLARLKTEDADKHRALSRLKEQIDQPLAAILTLNTIAHTVGATGVGAQVALVFGDGYLAAASAIMTFLILVLSEIIPKTLGARYWPQIAPLLPPFLKGMILLLKPFIWLSDRIMGLMGGSSQEADLRLEIKALSTLGRDSGQLDEDERRVIANTLDLHDVSVKDIMTPRIVCEALDPDMTAAMFRDVDRDRGYSRYPVLDDDENPLGLLMHRDLIQAAPETRVRELMKPITVVSDMMNAESLLSQFLRERQHLVLVYDEYGSWLGLVTLEDVLETLIGQPIMDETDDIPDMRRYARQRWKSLQKQTLMP
jgi:CBS domain containing-hemolysin-like protein